MPATAFCFAGQARSLHIAPVWRSAQKHVFAVARHHRQTADLFAVLDANYTGQRFPGIVYARKSKLAMSSPKRDDEPHFGGPRTKSDGSW